MRKFQPDEDYSTKNSYRFDERCLYIVKCDEDFDYTEAYLSPEFIREYSIGSSFKVEPLQSRDGTQAFLLEQWGMETTERCTLERTWSVYAYDLTIGSENRSGNVRNLAEYLFKRYTHGPIG